MKYRRLGHTELEISQVSFGTSPLGEMFGPLDEEAAIRLVHEAIDLGVNFIDTSRFYESAEERLGKALAGKRDRVVVGTKTGRFGAEQFDFSAVGVRSGVEESLRLLGTDYVDILQLHDVEFASLEQVLGEGYAELLRLRDEGKCRYVGMTGYPVATMRRVMSEVELDVLLTYAKGTLLDDSIRQVLVPLAEERRVGLINAAAVSLGLLTSGSRTFGSDHPATRPIREAAVRMVELCHAHGVDPAFIANQYAIQRSGCATTLIGTANSAHLRAAIDAASTPIDEDLLAALIALRPPLASRQWRSGLPENN